jgi:hypothetical protein
VTPYLSDISIDGGPFGTPSAPPSATTGYSSPFAEWMVIT